MPILEIQKRLREVGRIRMGDKKAGHPNKLDAFRLTTADRTALEAAAAVFGGTVQPWKEQAGQFELYITAPEINILISPLPVTQWLEMWSAGGCQRRCDGCTEQLSGNACMCPADHEERAELAKKGKACSMVTRLSVMLPELPSLGVWRLESHGFYAATELPMSAEILANSAEKGQYIPATLAIEHRKRVTKGQTKQFIVPVIRLRQRLSDYLPIAGQSRPVLGGGAPALSAGGGPAALPSPTGQSPNSDDPQRREIEDAAMSQLRERGWHVEAHKTDMTQFKNACSRGSLWWPQVFVEACDNRLTEWPEFIALANRKADAARDEKEAKAKAEAQATVSPFEETLAGTQ